MYQIDEQKWVIYYNGEFFLFNGWNNKFGDLDSAYKISSKAMAEKLIKICFPLEINTTAFMIMNMKEACVTEIIES